MPTIADQPGLDYFTAMNEEAKYRVTIAHVANIVTGLMRARPNDPTAPFTPEQMKSHKAMLELAVKHNFVRNSDVWIRYMASRVAQALEDERWQSQSSQDYKNVVKSE